MRSSRYCLAALLTLSGFTPILHAQITVDQEMVVLTPDSGRVASLTLRNDGATSRNVTVQLEDWSVDARGESHWQKSGVVAGACGRRVSVSPGALQLAPGERQQVQLSVAASARFDAECWSAAVIRTSGGTARDAAATAMSGVRGNTAAAPATGDTPGNTAARTAMGDMPGNTAASPVTVPLYVTPRGLRADGELTDMYVKGDSLEVVYRNTGRLRTDIVGEIQVQTSDNTVVTTVPLDSTTVLVGATRRFRVAMPKLPRGQYVLVALVDFGGDQLTAVQAALDMR